ncbi:ribonuclease H-like domain-containing protein [Tanacetum coccineum]
MVTRTQDGTRKITQRLNLHVSHIFPIPKSPSLALSDPHWRNAMYEEYNALIKNGTWVLVPRPSGANIVRCLWLFRHKFHADGSLSRYKARLVANGSSQQLGIDCNETFSLVVKPATIRTVLSLALTIHWPIHQLDVKNAFLNGDLSKTVYMHQPLGFVDPRYPHHVCRLQRSGTDTTYLLIYVDDIVLTALLCKFIFSLQREFNMTDVGALNHFLGISVTLDTTGMLLSQKRYVMELLERAHMLNCNPTRTPVDTKSKLGPEGLPFQILLCIGVLHVAYNILHSLAQIYADWAGALPLARSNIRALANCVDET